MIVQTVHLPVIYDPRVATLVSPGNPNLYYEICTNVLDSMLAHSVVMCDSSYEIRDQIQKYVDSWPAKHRDAARKVIKQLEQKHRFVPRSCAPISDGLHESTCRIAWGIAHTVEPDIVYTPVECQCGSVFPAAVGLPFTEHSLRFPTIRDQTASHVLDEGIWTQKQFSHYVWERTFRYAKSVKIFDRHIGRSATQKALSARNNWQQFRKSLEWIYKSFLSISSNPMRFEVTTEVGRLGKDISVDTIRKAGDLLEDFALSLSRGNTVEFRLNVRVSDLSGPEMHHDRFLITDQVAVQFGRGFDLLDKNDRLRGGTITLVDTEKARVVEESAKKLDAVSSYGSQFQSLSQLLK